MVFLTNYFPTKKSVKQGCPASALLFALCADPLCLAINANSRVEGIPLPMCNRRSLLFQHADDTTVTTCNISSVFELLKIFELYCNGTGAKINYDKILNTMYWKRGVNT